MFPARIPKERELKTASEQVSATGTMDRGPRETLSASCPGKGWATTTAGPTDLTCRRPPKGAFLRKPWRTIMRVDGKLIPQIIFRFQRGLTSKTVRGAVGFVDRICPQEGAIRAKLIERRLGCGTGRSTAIVVRSTASFDESKAEAWWERIRTRCQKQLPHQRLLEEPLSNSTFSFTRADILQHIEGTNDLCRRE